jgi:hypothetical protein
MPHRSPFTTISLLLAVHSIDVVQNGYSPQVN